MSPQGLWFLPVAKYPWPAMNMDVLNRGRLFGIIYICLFRDPNGGQPCLRSNHVRYN